MSAAREVICRALPRSQDDFIADDILRALDEAGFRVVPKGRRCPWGKGMPDPGIEPTDPCPVCGDLGTLDFTEPSKCIE